MTLSKAWAVCALILAVGTACSSTESPDPDDGESSGVRMATPFPNDPNYPDAVIVSPVADVLDERRAAVASLSYNVEEASIGVEYWAGPAGCDALAGVRLEEATDKISLEVLVGTPADGQTRPDCASAPPELYRTALELEAPVGERLITMVPPDPTLPRELTDADEADLPPEEFEETEPAIPGDREEPADDSGTG